jgi:hypothetical protein
MSEARTEFADHGVPNGDVEANIIPVTTMSSTDKLLLEYPEDDYPDDDIPEAAGDKEIDPLLAEYRKDDYSDDEFAYVRSEGLDKNADSGSKIEGGDTGIDAFTEPNPYFDHPEGDRYEAVAICGGRCGRMRDRASKIYCCRDCIQLLFEPECYEKLKNGTLERRICEGS